MGVVQESAVQSRVDDMSRAEWFDGICLVIGWCGLLYIALLLLHWPTT